MTYQSEDEREKADLKREAERDAEIALERQRLQQKTKDEAHERTVRADIERLEREREKKELEIRALELEERQLDVAIRKGYGSSVREAHTEVRTEETTIRELKEELTLLERKEHDTEIQIRQHERDLDRARQEAKDAEGVEEKGTSARLRKETHEERTHVLTREIAELHRKIEDLKRGLLR